MIDKKIIESLEEYVRAANYLSVTQIYLQNNFLLDRSLEAGDIKRKLFGHWGTCPGINFVYANLQYLVKKHQQSTIFVLGPGHGFPALQANLFLEGTLKKYYPEAAHTKNGIAYISKLFSWPYGFSSHSNPEAPGLILEGGELGYSLSTAYGAILDNPDLLAVCLIGDGEAETGSIATSWHLNKLIDPAENGAVLPILHVNGYKISGPTIFGRMSDAELKSLFEGYGYEPFFVSGQDIYEKMVETLEICLTRIHDIQKKARLERLERPRFPMIILQSPKGWTGPKELSGEQIEGSIKAHQVVAPNARKAKQELEEIEKWLRSYAFEELYDRQQGFSKNILDILPPESLRIGNNKHVYSGKIWTKLKLPSTGTLSKKVDEVGRLESNSMRLAGEYLREVFQLNAKEKNFRLMSPDETYSNRLDSVFQATSRGFAWPILQNDKDISHSGRVMEMLSEHNLHGFAQGYILTGRHAVFTTYEAFAPIFASMSHQYEKFLKVARNIAWRGNMSSMNYLLSSVLWRQEHNGFTHQNPSLIGSLLEKHDCNIQAFFPVDDNSMLAVMEECLSSIGKINIIVAGKTVEPRWVTYTDAKEALIDGMAIWEKISDKNPDIVVVGVGDYVSKEALAAIELVRFAAPEIKIRFVNISKLWGKCNCPDKRHAQFPNAEKYFTEDKWVIINFHGYPETIEPMVLPLKNPHRFSVHGYQEQGGTTTPFDMQVRNQTDRYHLAIEIIQKMGRENKISSKKAEEIINNYTSILDKYYEYIITYGTDPIELEEWHWSEKNMKTDATMQLTILNSAKTIGIVGLSPNPDRYSYKVAQYLQEQGYKVIPINPSVTEVLGEKAYDSLLSVPQNIKMDIVTLYRKSEEIDKHIDEIIRHGHIPTVWLPEGVRDKIAEEKAQKHGLMLVSDFCIMKVHQRARHVLG